MAKMVVSAATTETMFRIYLAVVLHNGLTKYMRVTVKVLRDTLEKVYPYIRRELAAMGGNQQIR